MTETCSTEGRCTLKNQSCEISGSRQTQHPLPLVHCVGIPAPLYLHAVTMSNDAESDGPPREPLISDKHNLRKPVIRGR
jgi:hypothetical protein